jgi:hypothetical protein
MICVAITVEAYEAIVATLALRVLAIGRFGSWPHRWRNFSSE